MFSNGEKFNPMAMEAVISAHPSVESALMFGQGRFEAGILVEPVGGDKLQEKNLLKEVWGAIEKANHKSSGFRDVRRLCEVNA